ncbi:hypothetical protein BDZ89DRAFT_433866 [Hymenopellis radicata]|nr:hypothetical protein BDZ89DRAFT_433866 [Hymenopellis radicata]
MKQIRHASSQNREVPPTYVNVTDTFVSVLGSMTVPATTTTPAQRYANVLTLNTAGSNLLLFSCPSTDFCSYCSLIGNLLKPWIHGKTERLRYVLVFSTYYSIECEGCDQPLLTEQRLLAGRADLDRSDHRLVSTTCSPKPMNASSRRSQRKVLSIHTVARCLLLSHFLLALTRVVAPLATPLYILIVRLHEDSAPGDAVYDSCITPRSSRINSTSLLWSQHDDE